MCVALLFSSCSGVRFASADQLLLVDNQIKVNGKNSTSDEDFEILRQRPNKSFSGIRLFLTMYGIGSKKPNTGVGKWLMNIGEAPVYYDSIQQAQSAKQLATHYFNLGYFDASVTSKTSVKGKKAKVRYDIATGEQYTMAQFYLQSTSRFIDSALAFYPKPFQPGDPIIAENFEMAQINLNQFLKDNGFYKAQLSWVNFQIDTTRGPDDISVTAIIDPYSYGGDIERKKLDRILAYPTYSYAKQGQYLDSTHTSHGIDVLQNERKFRPEFIDQQIFLTQGQYYDNSAIKATYKNLVALGVFKSVEIDVLESDGGLETDIKLVPLPKRSISTGIEGLGNSGSLGIGGHFDWDNRNVFGGGEIFRFTLGGSLTEQRNSTNTSWLIDARELNAAGSLRIPKLLLPNVLLPAKAKEWQPRTEIGLKSSFQYRSNEFNRNVASAYFDYHWKRSGTQHNLTPWRLSFVQIDLASDSTLAPFLFVGFQDLVFVQSGYRFQRSWSDGNTRYFTSMDLESGGHLWNLLGADGINQVPVIPFAKGSLDLRAYKSLVRKRELAARTFLGLSQSWSSQPFMPFEKSFFMGGANDLRGWTAYHFGPGATSESLLRSNGYFAAAPIKLVMNLEYRFTIQEALKGAVYLDAGNMWLYNRDYGQDLTPEQQQAIDAGTFGWSTFYKQLGLNTGYGVRYDLEFFIIRADLSLKAYHPGAENRSNWVIQNPKWHDFNLSLGIGYPF